MRRNNKTYIWYTGTVKCMGLCCLSSFNCDNIHVGHQVFPQFWFWQYTCLHNKQLNHNDHDTWHNAVWWCWQLGTLPHSPLWEIFKLTYFFGFSYRTHNGLSYRTHNAEIKQFLHVGIFQYSPYGNLICNIFNQSQYWKCSRFSGFSS